jgi:hypothetical protein
MAVGTRFLCILLCLMVLTSAQVSCVMAASPITNETVRYPVEHGTVTVDNRFLTLEPEVAVEPDGTALITWQTKVPTPSARVYYGLFLMDQELAYPRLRSVVRERDTEQTREHEVRIQIPVLERPEFDGSRLVELRQGVIAYRIEVIDPVEATARFYDRRFRYRRTGDSYVKAITIKEGPFVDLVTAESVTISWETDKPCFGLVRISGGSHEPGLRTTHHVIEIDGLSPETRYPYAVLSYDPETADTVTTRAYSLKTAPNNTDDCEFRFVHFSDSREGIGGGETSYEGVNHRILSELMIDAYRRGADLILFGGDLINGYTTSPRDFELQLEAWKRSVEPVAHYIPIYEGMGNHEALIVVYGDDTAATAAFDRQGAESAEAVFAAEFVNPANGPEPEGPGLPPYRENVYSFDYGNTHFVCFNNNYWWSSHPEQYGGNLEGHIMAGQLEWIEQDLAAARDRGLRHLIMFAHEPAFPNGGHIGDAMYYSGGLPEHNAGVDRSYVIEMRDRFWEIASRYDVLAVCFGDEHNYNRTLIDNETPVYPDSTANQDFVNPVWQLINGAAGAPFYARNRNVPWAGDVVAFSSQYCYELFSVEGDEVFMTTYSHTGQILDQCELTAVKQVQ